MGETTLARVRTFLNYRWLGDQHGEEVRFCGGCGQCISGIHGHDYHAAVLTPDDLVATVEARTIHDTETSAYWQKRAAALREGRITADEYAREGQPPGRPEILDYGRPKEYRYFAFCPWCGAEFPDNWWSRENTIIENERPIDHYQNPGHHKGDTHEFRGDGPGCMENHYLGTTGDELCWCSYEVEPGILGCVIRHGTEDYATAMRQRQPE